MKVTLIAPYYVNIWEPLWAGYLISYCKKNYKKDIEFDFYHGNFDGISDMLINEVYNNDIVGISCTTPTYNEAVNIAKQLKSLNKNVHIVLGGWHPTIMKDIENDYVDQVVVGEGEAAFLDILNGNRDKIVYGEKLTFSKLPWPDRDITKYGRQVDWCEKEFGERIASVQSVRGCKMSCAMCGERYMTGRYNKETNPLRLRLPKDTLDEVDLLKNRYNIGRFKFVDPTWSVDDDYVATFCYEKIRRGNYLPWDANVHAGIATEFSIRMMSKANCDVIAVGVESGSQKILNDIRKGITVDKVRKVFEWGKKYGLKRRAYFMLGMPNEDLEDVWMTVKLIKEIDPDIMGMTFLAPYPGTDMYNEVKDKNIDWSKVDEYSNDIWRNKRFTNEELKMIQKGIGCLFKEKLPWHQTLFLDKE